MSKNELTVPSVVREVSDTLQKAGYQAYLVGGCVRDLLIGKEPKDWDITTNARPEDIQKIFEETFYENNFGTVGVVTRSEDPRLKVVEITPFRIEGKYSDARRPDEVTFSDNLEDDLQRRDFTINAIAYDPKDGTLVDLHGGQDDIARKVIKTVGDAGARFEEDALRMLRAIRLSAELDFAIDTDALTAITAHASQLEKISSERVRDELTRILMSPRPMQAIFIAQKLGILKHVIPALEDGIGCAQNQAHSFDVFEHLLRSLQHAADKEWPLEVRLAALFHDVGKPATREWSDEKNDWTFHGHDVVSARMTKKILADLKYPGDTIEKVVSLVRWHMFFSDPDLVTLSAVRRLIARVGTENIEDLVNLRVCDRIGTGRPKEHPFRLRKYMSMIDEAQRDPISVSMLKIDGARLKEMGFEPGPRFGWTLHALLEEVLDDPAKNTSEYLEQRAGELIALPESDLKALGEQGKDKKEAADQAEVAKLRKKHHVFETKPQRVVRSDLDLLNALDEQLGILKHALQSVKGGDYKFVKTIASTLRVLVHSSRTNKPLLLSLADKFDVTPTIVTDEPRGIARRDLKTFLNEPYFASGTQNIRLSNADLIAKYSQQEGGSHEDAAIDFDLHFSKGNGILIGGLPPLVRKFLGMGECIHSAGIKAAQEMRAKLK